MRGRETRIHEPQASLLFLFAEDWLFGGMATGEFLDASARKPVGSVTELITFVFNTSKVLMIFTQE
jgi:hypothetical protein